MKNNQIYQTLIKEKNNKIRNGLYHKIQIDFTYNSNHIEGSKLTKDQTRSIFETNSFLADKEQVIRANDILEANNHFKAFNFILDSARESLNIDYLKKLHSILKANCSNIATIGDFKQKQNFVGDIKTTPPKLVEKEISNLIKSYEKISQKSINDIIDFHFEFETIHPFEDGNGRVGRLLMFKECLKENIVPFIIDEEVRLFYYRGLKEYKQTKGYLLDTCLSCQDKFKETLEYFGVEYTTNKTKEKALESAKTMNKPKSKPKAKDDGIEI